MDELWIYGADMNMDSRITLTDLVLIRATLASLDEEDPEKADDPQQPNENDTITE